MRMNSGAAILLVAAAILVVACNALEEVGFVSAGFRFDFDARASPGKFTPVLSSRSGDFAAGFLKNDEESFTLAIVGLDRNSSQPLDTIWMANRDNPIAEAAAAAASFVFDGNFAILERSSGEILWSIFKASSAEAPEVLELLDSGNLQLRSNGTSIFWQSFDHPADILLQGQNFTREMKLISSASPKNPKSGPYSLQLGTDRLILFHAPDSSSPAEPYWENAALQEPSQLVTGAGSMYVRVGDGFLGMYQDDRHRVNFVPFASQNSDSSLPNSTIRRARVDPDGNLRVYYWLNGEKITDYEALDDRDEPCRLPVACGEYGICSLEPGSENKRCSCPSGAFTETARNSSFSPSSPSDPSLGCVPRNSPSLCRQAAGGSEDDFLEVQGLDYVANEYLAPVRTSLEQCRAGCLSVCSCKAFFFRNDSSSCFHTSQLQSMLKSANNKDIAYIRVRSPLVLSSSSSSTSRKHRSFGIALLVICGLVSVVAGLCCFLRYGKFRNRLGRDWNSDEEAFLGRSTSNKYSYSELEAATNGFRSAKSLKNSGEFSGTLANNARIIVLRFDNLSKQEFQSRAHLTEKLSKQHPNLASPCGYCIHSESSFLVFEQQGSTLTQQLQQERDWGRAILLDDNSKMNLAMGIAKGLAFLHSQGLCFQGQIMPGTILVDEQQEHEQEELVARLCGLVQICSSSNSHEDSQQQQGEVRCFGRIVVELLGSNQHDVQDASRRSRFVQVAETCCCDHQGPPSMATVVDMLQGASRAPLSVER